ncbi:MAG: MarR family transcriptional regulator [Firmicutes bacterium]|nr:MarR family transcriptional regulator [Bacillota bacterium]
MKMVRDRVISLLREHPQGVDDDELARALGLRHRQQASSTCRQLAQEGLVERRVVGGKIRWRGQAEVAAAPVEEPPTPSGHEPWFWEGNVQASVVKFLKERRYSIVSFADPRRRERGKDIEAENPAGGLLWVTVKGYPEGTPRTNPSTQAQHWFKDAFFDLVCWRGERKDVALAIGLPDFPRYRAPARKVSWVQPILGFSFIWVREGGEATVEGDLPSGSPDFLGEGVPCGVGPPLYRECTVG